MKRICIALLGLLAWGAGLACAQPLRVVTSINILSEPLSQVFADEIAAGELIIEPLMDIGTDPHLYVPNRADLAKIVSADVAVFIGLGLEAQFNDVLRRMSGSTKVVFAGESVPKDMLLGEGCDLVSEANCFADPHIWMDPLLYKFALGGAVKQLAAFNAQWGWKLADVEMQASRSDQEVRLLIANAQISAPMITAHDAFGYFSRAYGVETLGLSGISTDVEPSVRRVSELADIIVEQKVPAVFLESTVPPRGIESLLSAAKARGQDVVIRGPLFTDSLGPAGSGAETWSGMLVQNSLKIACAIGANPTAGCEQ